jgi:exosome complex RNA-binding protein Rrp4
MNQDKKIPISVVALRADDYSPDGNDVIISLTTKYSTAERKFSVPIQCFYDLILDLQRLNASTAATSIKASIEPAVAPNPAEDLNQ